MLNYGAKAQAAFGVNNAEDTDLANYNITGYNTDDLYDYTINAAIATANESQSATDPATVAHNFGANYRNQSYHHRYRLSQEHNECNQTDVNKHILLIHLLFQLFDAITMIPCQVLIA